MSYFGTSTAGGPFGDLPNKGDRIKVTGFQGPTPDYYILDEEFVYNGSTGFWTTRVRPEDEEDGVIEVTLDMLYRCACGGPEAVHENGKLMSELFRVNQQPCGPVDWEVNE